MVIKMKKIKIDMQITELYVPEEANWIAMDQDGKWVAEEKSRGSFAGN